MFNFLQTDDSKSSIQEKLIYEQRRFQKGLYSTVQIYIITNRDRFLLQKVRKQEQFQNWLKICSL